MSEEMIHLSGALIIADLSQEEINAMMGITERKIIAQQIQDGLRDVEPGAGKVFGLFDSETEAKRFSDQITAQARKLGWYEGRTNRASPFKKTTTQVKDLNGDHPEFAEADPNQYVVKVLRLVAKP